MRTLDPSLTVLDFFFLPTIHPEHPSVTPVQFNAVPCFFQSEKSGKGMKDSRAKSH